MSLLPPNGKLQALYKFSMSMNRVTPSTWYTDKPLGVNSLKKVIKSIAEQAGLMGRFSNYSLCATTATQLYQGGVDEQTIKEVTGHKSDAMQMYKYSNTQILWAASHKIVSEEENNALVQPAKIEWDDKSYCDSVLAQNESEKVKEVMVPGTNNAHQTLCKQADKDGNCTALCSILKHIDEKQ